MYNIEFTLIAREETIKLQKSEPLAFKKLEKLVKELEEHPYTGTGKPKPLSGNRSGQWARRITNKHRLVYTVDNNIVTVTILQTLGHYDDK